jgi:hypothetical protein
MRGPLEIAEKSSRAVGNPGAQARTMRAPVAKRSQNPPRGGTRYNDNNAGHFCDLEICQFNPRVNAIGFDGRSLTER